MLASSAALRAEELAPLVVVVSSDPDAPFVRRLAAELTLFGYRVELSSAGTSDGDLEAVLRASGGSALIAVDRGGQTAEVVVGERPGSGPARHERERLDPRRRPDTNAAVLAERFRARLTELGIAPAPSAPLAEPPLFVAPKAPPAPPRPTDHRFWVAGALGASSGGIGVMPDAELELRVFPAAWLSTSAFARFSLQPATVRGNEGETEVRVSSGGVLIDAYPVRSELRVKVGVGVMLVSASMQGRAEEPFKGATDSVLVPAGVIQSGVGYRLAPRVIAELRAFGGACVPRVGVRFDERTVARFGQPLFGATLGVAIGVF